MAMQKRSFKRLAIAAAVGSLLTVEAQAQETWVDRLAEIGFSQSQISLLLSFFEENLEEEGFEDADHANGDDFESGDVDEDSGENDFDDDESDSDDGDSDDDETDDSESDDSDFDDVDDDDFEDKEDEEFDFEDDDADDEFEFDEDDDFEGDEDVDADGAEFDFEDDDSDNDGDDDFEDGDDFEEDDDGSDDSDFEDDDDAEDDAHSDEDEDFEGDDENDADDSDLDGDEDDAEEGEGSDEDSPDAGSSGPGMIGGTPHAHDCNHDPAFAAVSAMTHTAVQSGQWSDPATWGGTEPNDGAFVQIPAGITVDLASQIGSRFETVRIDGTLRFASNSNSELQLDTLYSACTGSLEIGSSEDPVQPEFGARVVFIDDGPVADDALLSRGAVLKGKTRIYGAPKTHRAVLSPHAQAGDRVLNLGSAPSGWRIGDSLVITGTTANDPRSDEIRTITEIRGRRVFIDSPLVRDHAAPKADLNVYVANVTRNVEFTSQNTDVAYRGHIMFMSADVVVLNASFTELGRTDKTRPLNDYSYSFDNGGDGTDAPESAWVTPLYGSNIRGRYSLHFHRAGTDASSSPAEVRGSVVFRGPGWGFVNHSSNVDFIDNVAYGLQGAGFYTEAGDEIGSMRGNIAIRSVNDTFELDDEGAIDPDLGTEFMDYGHQGDGYWLTGTRVSLVDNVSAGATAHGFIYWTDGIIEPVVPQSRRVTIPVADLPNGDLITDRTSVPVWWAPLAESRGNESYGATIGFRSRYIHSETYLGLDRDDDSTFQKAPPQAYLDTLSSEIRDLTVWGNRDGILLNYNERVSLIGARVHGFGRGVSRFELNEGTAKEGIGLDVANEATVGPARIEDVQIEGYGMGFGVPVNGSWQLRNFRLRDNETDVLFIGTEAPGTQVQMENVDYQSYRIIDGDRGNGIPSHVRISD